MMMIMMTTTMMMMMMIFVLHCVPQCSLPPDDDAIAPCHCPRIVRVGVPHCEDRRRHSLEQVRDVVTGDLRMDFPSVLQKPNECTVKGLFFVTPLAGAYPFLPNKNSNSWILIVMVQNRPRWQKRLNIVQVVLFRRDLGFLPRAGRIGVELATRGKEFVFELLAIGGALGRFIKVVLGAFFAESKSSY